MKLTPTILDILKCGVCGVQLSRGPVYLQHDGAALCGPCFTPERKATRNVHYEALAQLHVFPCKYSELGCKETVPFVQGSEVIPHEEVCEHRQWVCPVLSSARCDWLGLRPELLKHCEDKHAELVLQNPCSLQHDIKKSNEKTYLLRCFQVLFLLHMKVSVATGKLYHSVRYLGRTEESKNFWFNLHIKRKNETITKECDVAPQGCLAIQEDTSLSLDINSLLSVLGGFDGTTFTLEVQRRVCEVVEVCAGCNVQGAALVFWDEGGWVCESCTLVRRACKNQAYGCNYRDVDIKCGIHERYFCERGTRCGVCRKDVKRGSLFAHRSSACSPVHAAGSMWGASRYGTIWELVSSAAGIALCSHDLDVNEGELILEVFIPVSSERLREFRCEVRVMQQDTGEVRTYTPDIQYNKENDWRINVGKTDFSTWVCYTDVSVDITKIN